VRAPVGRTKWRAPVAWPPLVFSVVRGAGARLGEISNPGLSPCIPQPLPFGRKHLALSPDGARLAIVAYSAHGEQLPLLPGPLKRGPADQFLAVRARRSYPVWYTVTGRQIHLVLRCGQTQEVYASGVRLRCCATPQRAWRRAWNPRTDDLFTPTHCQCFVRLSSWELSVELTKPTLKLQAARGPVFLRETFSRFGASNFQFSGQIEITPFFLGSLDSRKHSCWLIPSATERT